MYATQQDTETNIIGSGALSYPWYVAEKYSFEYNEDIQAPDGWSIVLTMLDPEDKNCRNTIMVTVNHAAIIRAMQHIIRTETNIGVSTGCENECHNFICAHNEQEMDMVDFDADTADQVLQVIAYGTVNF